MDWQRNGFLNGNEVEILLASKRMLAKWIFKDVLALLSVVGAIGRAGRKWDCSGLSHVARRCFGTKWYDDVPGARSTQDGDIGNEDNSS